MLKNEKWWRQVDARMASKIDSWQTSGVDEQISGIIHIDEGRQLKFQEILDKEKLTSGCYIITNTFYTFHLLISDFVRLLKNDPNHIKLASLSSKLHPTDK